MKDRKIQRQKKTERKKDRDRKKHGTYRKRAVAIYIYMNKVKHVLPVSSVGWRK